MKTITLKSGNTFELQEADFVNSWELTQLIASELSASLPGLKIDSLDPAELLEKDIDLGKFISVILRLVASKPVYAALWPCFASCLYNTEKIDRSTFETPKSRPDFIPCVLEILKLNVLPFIKGLDLASFASGPAPKK